MKKITKTLLGILTGVMLMGMTVSAAEYTVTDTDAVLWTNGSTVVQADASADAPIALPSMEIGTPVHITGITSNGYWRVEIDGATYYIVGAGLGDTIVTDEYIRKYYDKPVIVNVKGVTIEIDYTEWNQLTHSLKMVYTATNNTPYTLDIKADAAHIYNEYIHIGNWRPSSASYVTEYSSLGEVKTETKAIAPGTSAVGCKYYHVFDNDFYEKNKVLQLSINFEVDKNSDVHGYTTDNIRFEDVYFYDYTTSAIRVEGTDEMRSIIGFKDVK